MPWRGGPTADDTDDDDDDEEEKPEEKPKNKEKEKQPEIELAKQISSENEYVWGARENHAKQ